MKLTQQDLKKIIKEEAERLEGMAEWKARVLGISQDDAI